MTSATFYVQECPTCGRRLQVRVQLLGKTVRCQHCGASFCASDPDGAPAALSESAWALKRADELLSSIGDGIEDDEGPALPAAYGRLRSV